MSEFDRLKSMKDAMTCAKCGHPQREHYGLNYADGLHVSAAVLVCPTVVFAPMKPPLPEPPRG